MIKAIRTFLKNNKAAKALQNFQNGYDFAAGMLLRGEMTKQEVEHYLSFATDYNEFDKGMSAATFAFDQTQNEPPRQANQHEIVAGALYDFLGTLTAGKERYTFSSADAAAPAVLALIEFAEKRSLLLHNPQIAGWTSHLIQVEKPQQEFNTR